jgi:hypothetical protein
LTRNAREGTADSLFTVFSTVGEFLLQNRAILRKCETPESPGDRNGAQAGENARKNSFLN